MEIKSGFKTTEFWMSAISSVFVAGLALLVGYGVISSEESDLWLALLMAVAPLAIAGIVTTYTKSRTDVKK